VGANTSNAEADSVNDGNVISIKAATALSHRSGAYASLLVDREADSYHEAAEPLEKPAFCGTRERPRARSVATRAAIPALLLAAWAYGTASGLVPSDVLASPNQVLQALLELQHSGQLRTFLGASLSRAGMGVTLGVSTGLALGTASGLTVLGEELIDPMLQMVRAVPFLALIPLLISWFGVDEKFKVVLIAVASAFPMYAHSYLGVRGVDRKVVEAAHGFGLRGWGLLAKVILPAALPNLLMALRLCLAISVVGLIAAEQVGTTQGIGYLVLLAKQYYRPDYMLLCILLYASLGLVFDLLIRLLERYMMPWRRRGSVRG
jgi:sulfonate transport system permease protein